MGSCPQLPRFNKEEEHMKHRIFPNTDVRVSEIGFGVWTVASPWWGVTDDKVGMDLLNRAYDLGITFFDTADNYGNGKGETLLAEALGDKMDKIMVGSKWGYNFYDHQRQGQQELPQDFSIPYLTRSIEASLKRLKRDRIDIYNLHNCRVDVIRKDEIFAALEKLKKEGKIGSYGVALGPALNERQAEEARVAIAEQKVHCVQIIYNLFEQVIGLGAFETARSTHSRFLVRVPHSSGLLEGKFNKDTTFSATDHRSFRKKEWLDEGLKKIDAVQFLLADGQRTIGQAALQFVLSEPTIASVLPNIYNVEQLEEFVKTPSLPPISENNLQQLREMYTANFGVEPAKAASAP